MPAGKTPLRPSESRRAAAAEAAAGAGAEEGRDGRSSRSRRGPRPRRKGPAAKRRKKAATAAKTTAKEEPSASAGARPACKPPARPALPDVAKEILVSVEVLEQTVAVLEDGKVAEVCLGRPSHRSIAGNIYKGVVDNVLPGMGVLRRRRPRPQRLPLRGRDRRPRAGGKRHGKRIQELILQEASRP